MYKQPCKFGNGNRTVKGCSKEHGNGDNIPAFKIETKSTRRIYS